MEPTKSGFFQLFKLYEHRVSNLNFGLMLLIVLSLFSSRFLLSVSIFALSISVMISLADKSNRFILQGKRKQFLTWIILPAIVFIWCLVSFFYSDNLPEAIRTTKVKGLFLLLPFTLLTLYTISKKQISYIYHFFILLALIGSLWSLLQIPIQKINLTDYYARGWVIPTFIHHIRFSLLTAFATILCWFMVFRQPLTRILPKYLYLILAAFFTAFLHILAVRSGLLGFYVASCFLIVLSLANGKKMMQKLIVVGLGLTVILIAFNSIPSLKSKVDYTVYSLNQYFKTNDDTEISKYSDNRRLISYNAAIQLIKEHPMLGVGVGDLRDEMNKFYSVEFPDSNMEGVQPHNQYLLTAVAIGIPGTIYLLVFNLLLLYHQFRRKRWVLVAFNLIFIFSFLVEDTLEMQIGVIAYLFFNYIGWHFNENEAQVLTERYEN